MVKVNLISKLLLNSNLGLVLEVGVLSLLLRNYMYFVILFTDL